MLNEGLEANGPAFNLGRFSLHDLKLISTFGPQLAYLHKEVKVRFAGKNPLTKKFGAAWGDVFCFDWLGASPFQPLLPGWKERMRGE